MPQTIGHWIWVKKKDWFIEECGIEFASIINDPNSYILLFFLNDSFLFKYIFPQYLIWILSIKSFNGYLILISTLFSKEFI